MTQDVEPLTWSKRTNIEEHREFFSKINEIIANLAPTVDEAEQAIAQATQAITNANAAIATANAASAAADAAAQSAQTSAATVAGYSTRLTAVEGEADTNAGNITALQGRVGTAEGNITALQNVQADYVKKAGAAQTVTSQIMVPTTATGLRDTQIANGTRIQNDLDAYEPMIRNTGASVKYGTFSAMNGVFGDTFGVSMGRTLGYYRTHDLGGSPNENMTWYINVLFVYRYAIRMCHIEASYVSADNKFTVATSLAYGEPNSNNKVTLDIIDGTVYLVVHRIQQSNVFSRITVLDIQKGASIHPVITCLPEGVLYTPAGELSEGDLS